MLDQLALPLATKAPAISAEDVEMLLRVLTDREEWMSKLQEVAVSSDAFVSLPVVDTTLHSNPGF